MIIWTLKLAVYVKRMQLPLLATYFHPASYVGRKNPAPPGDYPNNC